MPGPAFSEAKDSICLRISGPALMRYQSFSLAVTASEDCNNGRSESFPERTA